MKGIIVKSTGSWFQVKSIDTKQVFPCRIRGKFRLNESKTTNPLAVGDIVKFEIEPADDDKEVGVVTELYPRNNYIIRKSNKLSSQSQIIASNIDLVIPVFTLSSPTTSQGFLDRILVTAEAYKIPVLIAFNKIDLYDDDQKNILNYWNNLYKSLGYDTIEVSALENINIKQLFEKIKGKTSLICGHSGSGKSTLLNILDSKLTIKTGAISNQHQKGKHTTTFAEMHSITDDTHIIDTPGIRDFGVIDIEAAELGHFFPEIKALMPKCKFHNCLHKNEPDCAVVKAYEAEEINPSRYYSYRSILEGEDSFG